MISTLLSETFRQTCLSFCPAMVRYWFVPHTLNLTFVSYEIEEDNEVDSMTKRESVELTICLVFMREREVDWIKMLYLVPFGRLDKSEPKSVF